MSKLNRLLKWLLPKPQNGLWGAFPGDCSINDFHTGLRWAQVFLGTNFEPVSFFRLSAVCIPGLLRDPRGNFVLKSKPWTP